MFTFYFILILIILSLYGFSYISKLIFTFHYHKKKNITIVQNIDLVYGVFFSIFLLIILHFFIPIKLISFLFFLIGFSTFIYFFFKKKFNFNNIIKFLLALFFLLYITSSHSPTYDTQLYHYQILNWNYDYKIAINLALIDDRLGMVSPWHLFLGLGNIKIYNTYVAYFLNYIPIILLILEILNIRKINLKIPEIFLILSVSFILIFSLIHPFQNGTILMHLGSLGTDLPAALFFILSICYFLRCFYENKYYNFYLLIIYISLAILSKISYITLLILPAILILNKKHFFGKNYFSIAVFFVFFFWIIRSVLNNGCIIFPAKNTCLNLKNFISPEFINKYSLVVKSFARTAPNHENFMNLDYTINSYKWFNDWFYNYFLTSSLTQIFLIIIIITIPFFLYNLKNIKQKKICIYLISFFILSLFLWLQAPDIRFAIGLLVSFPCYVLTCSLNNDLNKLIQKYHFLFISIIFFSIVIKNIQNFQNLFEKAIFVRNYNYSTFTIDKKIDNFIVRSNKKNQGFCYDIELICINNSNRNFEIHKTKYNYLIFK